MQEIDCPVPKRRLSVELSVEEVLAVYARLQGEHPLPARLLCGTGMRITEALCLPVKGIDLAQRAIWAGWRLATSWRRLRVTGCQTSGCCLSGGREIFTAVAPDFFALFPPTQILAPCSAGVAVEASGFAVARYP